MTSRRRHDLLNNPCVYFSTRGRLVGTAPCIGVSEKHSAGYGAGCVCGPAVGAALRNRNLAGTAEAKRTRCAASAAPERQKGRISGETVRRTANRSCTDCTNRTFTCITGSMLGELWMMGASDPDMPMDMDPDKHHEIRYDWILTGVRCGP